MDAEAFVNVMLETDSSIRYVGVVSDEYRILASKQREGVPSHTSDEVESNFFSIVPQIVSESVEKLSPFLGNARGITVHYDKVLLVLYRFENKLVFITFQPEVATSFYERISDGFRKLSTKYLT